MATTEPNVVPAQAVLAANTKRMIVLDGFLFVVVALMLSTLVYLLLTNLAFQRSNYTEGIRLIATSGPPVDHGALLTYSRSMDFAVVKTGAMFMGFILVFVGALYVLRTADSPYSLSVEGAKGALVTSSPGLVMVTLGVMLIVFVLRSVSYASYDPPTSMDLKQTPKNFGEIKP